MTTAISPSYRHSAASHSALTDLLAQQVGRQPRAVAVHSGDQVLTYAELYTAAELLGRRLRAYGARSDEPIGLFVEPSVQLMTGAWGILASGGAYLPLSPDYPEDRLRYMLEDSGVRLVVTQGHLRERAERLAPPGTRIVVPEQSGAAGPLPQTEDIAEEADGDPSHLAYVIYTSGSTGRPKGVMVEQHSVMSQLRWMQSRGYLGPETAVLQKTPMSFDAAQWEILAPAAGGRVVMGTPGIYRDPEAIIDASVRYRVTTLQCVPTLLQALLDTEKLSSCAWLSRVFSGGEALTVKLARQFHEVMPDSWLINLYGPTECTINATAHVVHPAGVPWPAGATTVPIGTPVDNTTCFILDENLQPVEIGEQGELYIGGAQLARGYLNLPEQTAERFVAHPFIPCERLYRTGDLASWNPDGTIQFSGRTDSQIKLRGYRVELEEIASAVEEHTWVRRAAAVVVDDARTGMQNLVACVELNPKEAALMDQGNHGSHHQSKQSKLQVKAQLANPGVRTAEQLQGRQSLRLPGARGTEKQRREVFARKTYRLHEGGTVTPDDLLGLLAGSHRRGGLAATPRDVSGLGAEELGELLRWFGPFASEQRLLPKYAYASPGALYATQLYLETGGIAGLDAGLYYFHPVDHALVRIGPACLRRPGTLQVHFLGNTGAIEPVYRNNIREVLEFEAGHMIGVFEEVLPGYGLTIREAGYRAAVKSALDARAEDHYLGTFEIVPDDGSTFSADAELFVQVHPEKVPGLAAGTYRWTGESLELISGELVEKRHVIAINQSVYTSASFGITAVSRAEQGWLEYLVLGTALHRLQRNTLRLGLMSSGYSSKSGHPLPAARQMDDLLAQARITSGASYFFLGGKVSDEQIQADDMREDAVHMRGPTEIIRDDLVRALPDYMVPNRVVVLDALPLTANGKIDCRALAASDTVQEHAAADAVPFVAPATATERLLAQLWGEALKYSDVSMADTFFHAGGNSLIAVTLTHRINRELGLSLPLQTLFEHPRLGDLADHIQADAPAPSARAVLLHEQHGANPVFCWPGLGGYPMNLRLLAQHADAGGAFYGIQSCGINPEEEPHSDIAAMAAADIAEIRRIQPAGPYRLWGYSFGSRVAFETAWQLEQAGEKVEEILLICPGNPTVRSQDADRHGREASWDNPAYLTILFSVFAGTVTGPELDACLHEARDEDTFTAFITRTFPGLEEDLVRRITQIVATTYAFEYTFDELLDRQIEAPVHIIKAAGDDYSFIEGASGFSATPPTVTALAADHYQVLRRPGVQELAATIRALTTGP
ncbi:MULTISPECIES: amino acid adenylation domain-containing protein [unclassified Streptomyces]|uniref:non-ribosomal peptide synthetase family protein n=1 Tax=unclassified Streptomyces TaxID=2593676 RepID=UPI00278C1663|nr:MULTISPECIES: amino acid adenylation domain-containing protein [unclassified Streptomyces]